MAVVGCLGDVVFSASREMVRTLDKFKWSGSARYTTHQRHGGNALTEFVGLDTDKVSFTITLSANLGVDPMAVAKKLWKYMRDGETLPLTLGEHAYGRYRWSILSLSFSTLAFDRDGNLFAVQAAVSLQEYLRG